LLNRRIPSPLALRGIGDIQVLKKMQGMKKIQAMKNEEASATS
jgi:hypothetical protein